MLKSPRKFLLTLAVIFLSEEKKSNLAELAKQETQEGP